MILVDTSVWVDHFRSGNSALAKILNDGDVICHPFIIGELACGNIKKREEILSLLQALPVAKQVNHDEILEFIEAKKLMGKGLGYVDMHLLSSALLSGALLWSLDKKLNNLSVNLNVGFVY